MKRARNNRIIVPISWDAILNKPEFESVTFETLDANGDIGTGTDQIAKGNHDHEVGDLSSYFANKLL